MLASSLVMLSATMQEILVYQTTENENEAITDIRMMQMTSGFSTVNYAELVERQYPGVASMIDDEYKTIREFREKVAGGSYNAKTALQYLNLFEIPELGMKLGDYYLICTSTSAKTPKSV